jgi:uncharacterized protein (UPF0305 family)
MKPTLRNSETLPSNLMSSFKLSCETRKNILNSQCKDILYVSKYFEEQASDPSTTPVNAYIQKTVDATSISERSIRRIGKEQYDSQSKIDIKNDLKDIRANIIRTGVRKYRALKVFLRGIFTILNFFFKF